MPSIATSGSAGTVNLRGISGRLTRMIQTPAHTSMKANNVPMLVISPTMSPGMNAAKSPVSTKNRTFDFYGVWKRG